MRTPVSASRGNEGVGVKYILSVLAFFALGFLGVMNAPKLMAMRHAAPVAAAEPAPEPAPLVAAAQPVAPARPAPRSFAPIDMPAGGIEVVRTDGTLAALSACRAALESGRGYDTITLDQFAAFVGGHPENLSPAQIKQGCKTITEGGGAALGGKR